MRLSINEKIHFSLIICISILVFIFFLLNFITPGLVNTPLSQLFASSSEHACKECHVLLISLDTLRADHLPCYGHPRNTAPNLCKFAEENVIFSQAYTQGSYTLDSNISMFTGLYPSSHHVLTPYKDILHSDIITLPQVLQAKGYETVYIAPVDDINLPLDKGIGRGFDSIIPITQTHNYSNNFDSWEKGLNKLISNAKNNKPTFSFFHTYAVHSPYLMKSDNSSRLFTKDYYPDIPATLKEFVFFDRNLFNLLIKSLDSRIEKSSEDNADTASIKRLQAIRDELKQAESLEEARQIFNKQQKGIDLRTVFFTRYYRGIDINHQGKINYLKALYDENIFHLDTELGKIFKVLKKENLLDKTIIIITADHGEEFAEHGQLEHGNNVYATTTHIPLIMSIPRIRSLKIDELVQSIDIYPTILGLLNIPAMTKLEGINLTSLILQRPNAEKNEYVVSEYQGGVVTSIRNNEWSCYVNNQPDKENELYNIANDSLEQEDLIAENSELEEAFLQALEQILKQKVQYPSLDTNFPDWIDPESRENLIKRGYF